VTFHVKLEGALHYPSATAAAEAHRVMMEGRAGNAMLEDGARVDGSSIVFAFDDALASGSASDHVDSAEFGIQKALETATTGSVTFSDETGFTRVKHALGREFWAKRWKESQIGFHEGAPNDLLAKHVARIETKRPARILVPLAGKAVDLRWLAERGHEVVGVEVVWEAVRAFFDEWKVDAPVQTKVGRNEALRSCDSHDTSSRRSLSGKGVTLVCADMFEVSAEDLGRFDVIYDRAALVALEPSTRGRYVEACRDLLAEGGMTLLVAFAYDQALTQGPPWSIDEAAVRELYAPRAIEKLEARTVVPSARLVASGIATIEETAYLIR
jgi:thiopurine S-methyltransferase